MASIGVLFSGFSWYFQQPMWDEFQSNGFEDGAVNPGAANKYLRKYAEGDVVTDRLDQLAHQLIDADVCAILVADTPSARAAIRARPGGWNGGLPIVMAFVGDPRSFERLRPPGASGSECGLPPSTYAFLDRRLADGGGSVGVRATVTVDLL